MVDVGTFYDHLVYFTAVLVYFCGQIWYILWLHFFPKLYQEKSGNPVLDPCADDSVIYCLVQTSVGTTFRCVDIQISEARYVHIFILTKLTVLGTT
jgi:hypothetical protein